MAPTVVLITGCSSGIGLASAVHLAKSSKRDFKVYATVIDLSQKADLESTAGDSLDKTLLIRRLDVTKEDTIASVVDEIVRDNGRIDVAVNNAGIPFEQGGFFFQKTPESLDKAKAMMDVNLWGAARVIQAVLPIMKKNKSGRIINTSSELGIEATPYLELYSASKFALEGLSESLAPVLRKGYNIRVIILEPWAVYSPQIALANSPDFKPEYVCGSWEEAAQDLYKEYWKKDLAPRLPLYQMPEDIAHLTEEIILSEDPHFRYQSSPILEKTVAAKLVDPTGDSVFKLFQAFQ